MLVKDPSIELRAENHPGKSPQGQRVKFSFSCIPEQLAAEQGSDPENPVLPASRNGALLSAALEPGFMVFPKAENTLGVQIGNNKGSTDGRLACHHHPACPDLVVSSRRSPPPILCRLREGAQCRSCGGCDYTRAR